MAQKPVANIATLRLKNTQEVISKVRGQGNSWVCSLMSFEKSQVGFLRKLFAQLLTQKYVNGYLCLFWLSNMSPGEAQTHRY